MGYRIKSPAPTMSESESGSPSLVRLTADRLTSREAARLAKVPMSMLNNWIARGVLTFATSDRRVDPTNTQSGWKWSLLDAINLAVMYDLATRCRFPLSHAHEIARMVAGYALSHADRIMRDADELKDGYGGADLICALGEKGELITLWREKPSAERESKSGGIGIDALYATRRAHIVLPVDALLFGTLAGFGGFAHLDPDEDE